MDKTTLQADGARMPQSGELPGADRIYRCIYENNTDGILLIGPTGKIAALNSAACRFLGYLEQELTGRLFIGLVERRVLPPPTERGIPFPEGPGYLDLIRRDGSSFAAETRLSIFRTGDTEITAVAFRDVTDRLRAEQALRESENRLRVLFENTTDIVCLLNADGTIRYHNPAAERLFGYSAGELSGMACFDLLHPEDRDRIMTLFTESLKQPGITLTTKGRIRQKDGTSRSIEGFGINRIDDPTIRGLVLNLRE
jgi:PAS domain S-box-containing protein